MPAVPNPSQPLRVAVLQHACSPNLAENQARVTTLIEKAADQGAHLVLCQELHQSLYFCQREDKVHFDLAEPLDGPSASHYAALAKRLGIVLVISIFERLDGESPRYFNTAIVFESDGSRAGFYRKSHIPEDPGFHEKFYFEDGDTGMHPIETSVGKLGVLVCWDQWFPEAARTMAMRGAELLLYPTAIGWIPDDPEAERSQYKDAWQTIQRSHAIANAAPVCVANRVGREVDEQGPVGHIDFWGGSFICGPYGEWLARDESTDEAVVIADVDLARSKSIRDTWPFMRDLRGDDYLP